MQFSILSSDDDDGDSVGNDDDDDDNDEDCDDELVGIECRVVVSKVSGFY